MEERLKVGTHFGQYVFENRGCLLYHMTAIRASTIMINTVSRPPIKADVSIKTEIIKCKFNTYNYISITQNINLNTGISYEYI